MFGATADRICTYFFQLLVFLFELLHKLHGTVYIWSSSAICQILRPRSANVVVTESDSCKDVLRRVQVVRSRVTGTDTEQDRFSCVITVRHVRVVAIAAALKLEVW